MNPITKQPIAKLPGLKVGIEELQAFQSSDKYDKTSGKSALTQYANWQKSPKGNQKNGIDFTKDFSMNIIR